MPRDKSRPTSQFCPTCGAGNLSPHVARIVARRKSGSRLYVRPPRVETGKRTVAISVTASGLYDHRFFPGDRHRKTVLMRIPVRERGQSVRVYWDRKFDLKRLPPSIQCPDPWHRRYNRREAFPQKRSTTEIPMIKADKQRSKRKARSHKQHQSKDKR